MLLHFSRHRPQGIIGKLYIPLKGGKFTIIWHYGEIETGKYIIKRTKDAEYFIGTYIEIIKSITDLPLCYFD